jgi:putative heme-binding domain-containing protein
VLHFDVDTWRAYNYIWNDEQTDAVLAPDQPSTSSFEIRDFQSAATSARQTWRHASRTECILCHTTRAGTVHGFKPQQLDRDHNYGAVVANQLVTFDHIGLFAEPPAEGRSVWPDPYDPSGEIISRARSYLHVNCGHCHRRGGGGTAALDVRFDNPLDRANLIDARPTQGTFGIHGAKVVAPGDPYRSVLYYRAAKLGVGRMPHFGSQVVDPRGLQLLREWISQLPHDADPAHESTARLRGRQTAALQTILSSAKTEAVDREEAQQFLLSSPSGALQLVTAIDDGELTGPLLPQMIERGAHHVDPRIRDLFERYISEDRRVKRLGAVVDRASILKTGGDAERGRALFLAGAGVQCRNCHKIGTAGRELGPDLSQVGKRLDREKLLESILEPSKAIDPKFVTYLVETREGQVHTGLLIRRSDDEIVLRNAEAKDVRIAATQIELVAPQQKSLMPDLLLQDLTQQQVADLLEFLSSQQ